MRSGDGLELMVEGGLEHGNRIPLQSFRTTLGRQAGNDVVLDEPGISRRHAEVIKMDSGFSLRDLSSINGTYVNDERVTEDHPLN